jgi:thymidylate synthase (FAD)
MTTSPKFRSDISVTIDEVSSGGDRKIAHRAWVEPPQTCTAYGSGNNLVGGHVDTEENWRRVISAMMKGRHGSAFEAGYLSVYLEVPVVVWWEMTRHRSMSLDTIDISFSLESGRYKVLDGEFYIPPASRPCAEPDKFKPMRPVLEINDKIHDAVDKGLYATSCDCWDGYNAMIEAGVAREVARLSLPFNLYYSGYVSGNPRSWLHFFSLRKFDAAAKIATFPAWEIQQTCEQIETMFAATWPLTYMAFIDNGRIAP